MEFLYLGVWCLRRRNIGSGGGLNLGGKLFTGSTGNAGYFGHHTISFESEVCVCGRTGCAEFYASGPQMVNYAKSLGWQSDANNFEALSNAAKFGNDLAIQKEIALTP